jgi:hypothetical protein
MSVLPTLPPKGIATDSRVFRDYLISLRDSISNLISFGSISGDTGTITAASSGQAIAIQGGTAITTAASGSTLTINAQTDWRGSSENFNTSGAVTSTGAVNFEGATSFRIPVEAAGPSNLEGAVVFDTAVTDHAALPQFYAGATQYTVPAITTAELTTTDGDVIYYSASANKFVMGPQAGGGGGVDYTAIKRSWLGI